MIELAPPRVLTEWQVGADRFRLVDIGLVTVMEIRRQNAMGDWQWSAETTAFALIDLIRSLLKDRGHDLSSNH